VCREGGVVKGEGGVSDGIVVVVVVFILLRGLFACGRW
jgi:hypothetical protein